MQNQPDTSLLARVLDAHRQMAGQFLHPVLRRHGAPASRRTPLLLYSQVAWDTVWQRPQEQALGLARHRPVIFLSPVQLHEYTARLADRWQFARVLEGGRLLVLSPLIFSGDYRSPLVRDFNRRIVARVARQALARRPFYLLTNSPFSQYLIPALRPARVIVDYIDDFAAFNWAPSDSRGQEATLLQSVDLAFAGTGFLEQAYRDRLPGIRYLPSGVKYDILTAPAEQPADIANLPHPRLLYVGTLNDRLDGNLFLECAHAAQRAGGCVVVVGPRHATFRAPELPACVHFLGLRPHDSLAGYYQHCDLGLMPFADCPAAHAINPIKTLEYLACGLPVLSSPIPDIIRFYGGVVDTAVPGEWTAAVERLLAADSPEQRLRRQQFARGRTWASLVESMERAIRTLEGAP